MRHTADDHLDEGTLQAWLDHPRSELSDDEVAAVEAHLSACEACAMRVAALEKESSSVAGLLGTAAASAPPPFAAIEARAREIGAAGDAPAGGPDRSGGSPGRNRVRRWRASAWAASIAVALGTGWMANELFRTGSAARGGFTDESVVAPALIPETETSPPPEMAERASGGASAAGESPPAPTAAADAAPGPGRRQDAPASGTIAGEPAAARALASTPTAKTTLRGRVVDAASGRPLESAQVVEPASGAGALTDATGTFALTVPAETAGQADPAVTLQVQLIGYGEADRRVALTSDTAILLPDVEMESTALRLQELVVTDVEARPSLTVVLSDTDWSPIDADAAAAELGFALRSVPELPVAEVALATVDETQVARVRQPLPGGGFVTVVQAGRALSVVESPGADAAVLRRLDETWVAVTAPGSRSVALEWSSRIR